MSTEIGGLRLQGRPMRVSHFFMGIDIARFMPLEKFIARMQELVGTVKQTAPARGYEEVLVAGEPEWRAEVQRTREGIPLDGGVWLHLSAVAESLKVTVPRVQ